MVLIARALVPLLVLALWAYAVFDVIATDESRIQSLPKIPWLLVVLLFPPIGPIAWLLLGRPAGSSFRVGAPPRRTRWVPPGDIPPRELPSEQPPPSLEAREDALRRYYEEKRQRDEEIRRLEDQLRGNPSDDPTGGGPQAEPPEDRPDPGPTP